jgi:hypothetical protein
MRKVFVTGEAVGEKRFIELVKKVARIRVLV